MEGSANTLLQSSDQIGSDQIHFQPIRFLVMHLLSLLPSLLLALSKSHTTTTWFIDGNNLYGHKGIPKNREGIRTKLQEINQRNTNVVLVWDGKKGVQGGYTSKEKETAFFTTITTREGLTADEYILSEIKAILESGVTGHDVQLVTGDRELRRLALATKTICTNAVDPVVFWKRYRPRLAGFKKPKTVTENTSSEEPMASNKDN